MEWTVERDYAREALPERSPEGHKGSFGEVLVLAGSVGYTGAAWLTAEGAVRGGCGLVHLGVPEDIWPVEAVKCTSAMPFPLAAEDGGLALRALAGIRERLTRCDVLALGPGLGRRAETAELVRQLLSETEKPIVLDADGINALAGHIDILDGRRGRVTVLTPHEGEFARIGDLSGGRVTAARDFAVAHGCWLVLKGHRSLTVTPWGTVLENSTGNCGMAKGGSGDVLTGLIAALLAQGAGPTQAAALGNWLHGRAGDLAAAAWTEYAMTPEDLLSCLPLAFRELTE